MPRPKGRELNEKWRVGARHPLYRESGDWYHVPRRFPAALFDAHGYALFETEGELEVDGISRSTKEGKDWLSVRQPGISSLVNYVRIDAGGLQGTPPEEDSGSMEGVPLREYDESERLAVQQSRTVLYRNRHRKITNALCRRFAALHPTQGQHSKNEYDVLLRNYDRVGRDLFIEVKPDPDRGSLRIAIGQLYDYRRFLNAAATDLAVLTIGKPNRSYLDLLLALGITSIWFGEESCQILQGVGTAWRSLRNAEKSNAKEEKKRP
jgi:hypothetical protein